MTEPGPDERGRQASPADPTLEVARPPVPGRAVRAEVAAGNLAMPPIRHDDPTVALTGRPPAAPHRALESAPPPRSR